MANAERGENAVDVTIAMTSANTEYSVALPFGVKALEIQCREAFDIRHSFVAGKVATPTDPFRTLKSGQTSVKETLWLGPMALYVACPSAGKNCEVRYWL